MVNSFFLDLLAPCHCLLCGQRTHRPLPLCSGCESELLENHLCCLHCALPLATDGVLCPVCQLNPPSYHHACCPWQYRSPVSDFQQRFKFSRDFSMLPLLVHLMQPAVSRDIQRHGIPDVLIPVPVHWWRKLQRGFNQSELLARELVRHPALKSVQLKVADNWCRKVRATSPQLGLGQEQRLTNLNGSFRCRLTLTGMDLAIVDDVMTTGATVECLSEALMNAGAERVRVWCVARTPAGLGAKP